MRMAGMHMHGYGHGCMITLVYGVGWSGILIQMHGCTGPGRRKSKLLALQSLEFLVEMDYILYFSSRLLNLHPHSKIIFHVARKSEVTMDVTATIPMNF